MKHLVFGVSLVLMSTAVSSCMLDAPLKLGEKCPPESLQDRTLGYIVDAAGDRQTADQPAYAKFFEVRACPENSAICQMDDDNQFYCMSPCADDKIAVNGECIDPATDDRFCGAMANDPQSGRVTPSGEDCTKLGAKCVDGRCHCYNGSSYANPLSDPEHCGKCNHACPQYPGTQEAIQCVDGVCVYDCADGFENCGSQTEPVCLSEEDFAGNPNHCGKCNYQCDGDDQCLDALCMPTDCSRDVCIEKTDDYHAKCYDTAEKCGPACLDCNTHDHATSGRCENHQCIAETCVDGYHPVDGQCKSEQLTDCGEEHIDCTEVFPNLKEGSCTDGECMLTSCLDGYHIYEEDGVKQCEKDSIEHCGSHGKACSVGALEYAIGVDCIDGTCQATACCGSVQYQNSSLYCRDNNSGSYFFKFNLAILCDGKCLNNKLNEKYKTECSQCEVCTSKEHQTCQYERTDKYYYSDDSKDGYVYKYEPYCACTKGYYMNEEGECEPCTTDNCCKPPEGCTTADVANSKSVKCDTGEWQCKAATCEPGYHLYEGSCEVNSAENCGSNGRTCESGQTCNVDKGVCE